MSQNIHADKRNILIQQTGTGAVSPNLCISRRGAQSRRAWAADFSRGQSSPEPPEELAAQIPLLLYINL